MTSASAKLPFLVLDRGLTVAAFKYLSDAIRYRERCGTPHFTIKKDRTP